MSSEPAIKEDGDHLILSGLLTVEHGRKLREVLRGILARGSPIVVSLAEVEDVDVAGLQLLHAARREALRENKTIIWSELSAACADMAALAGMSESLGFPPSADPSTPE